VAGFALVAAPTAAASWEDFNGDFETGDFSQYLEVQALPDRATIVEGPVGEGPYAARFERRAGDEPVAGSSRSEVVPGREFHTGETLYFRHLLYLPFGSIDWSHFLILCQWHDSSAGSPPLSLLAVEEGGVKMLRIATGDQHSTYYQFPIPGDSEWFELVYRVSFGISGSIEVWLDGESLGEVSEIDTLGTEPTNWKLGAYRSAEAVGATVVYQDGVKITDSFFSHPPGEPEEEVEEPAEPGEPAEGPGEEPAAKGPDPKPSASATPTSTSISLPSSEPQASTLNSAIARCQSAQRKATRKRARLNAVRRRYRKAWPAARRRRRRRRVHREAKRYRRARQEERRICRQGSPVS
jgi:Polysaccharide lyase